MSDNRTFVRIVIGLGAAVILGFASLVCCTGGVGWFGSGAFVRFGIGTDLDDYVKWVAASDLAPEDKTEVDQRLREIREDVSSGDVTVPFVVWVDIDDTIEGVLFDGHVPPNELAILHDQLNRIESYR